MVRNANLERYLGMADLTVDGRGLTNIFTPESSPKEPKVVKVTTLQTINICQIMLSFAAQEVKRANQDNVPSEENDAAVQQIFAVQAEEGGRRSCAGRQRGLCRVGNGSTQATQC